MRSLLLAVLLGLVASVANAQLWVDQATLSPTTTLVSNSLCYSDGRDLACNGAGGLLITSGTVAFTNISATALSITTINGKSVANLGVSTLASLTDVSETSVGDGMLLRYNGGLSKWESVGASTALSTTTMTPNFPDAIRCTLASPYFERIFYQYSPTDGTVTGYVDPQSSLRLTYNSSTGAYTGISGSSTSNCNVSISAIYAIGRAFNFIGTANSGSTALGDRIISGTLLAVANSATGFISLTTVSTTWGYLSSGANYLPSLTSTNVSAATVTVSANNTGCTAATVGSFRRNPATNKMQICQDH